jgi:prepilin-type N-terminal cleavage/methylation domain-containing protein
MSNVRQNRRAFTLLELMLVMALLVILGALCFPTLESMYGHFRVTAAADEVRTAWAQARAQAMNDGTPYRFSVVWNKGNYRIAPDTGDFWGGNGAAPAATDPANPALVMEAALPKGVRFTSPKQPGGGSLDQGGDSALPPDSVDPGSWATAVTFLPDGTAREDVEMVFRTAGASPVVLKLRGLTGVVTTGNPKP